MATVRPLRPFERADLDCALSEARAARYLLCAAASADSAWPDSGDPEEILNEHMAWIRDQALDWLRLCHDKIEDEFRKLGTTNVVTPIRTAADDPTPKDGA
jgi:hypothetical protein